MIAPAVKILDAGIDQRHRWTDLVLAGTKHVRGCGRKNQRRPEAPSAPRLFDGDEVENLQVSRARYTLRARPAAYAPYRGSNARS